ncbi:MAG TPA: indole-3-glycerol phosphate synthase TrpC [Candidatus Brocadiia bacterium]|nr:indole-3-glycerol phosphate synthase TrpC [Candidatus Brocadiales bacterium]
MFILDKICSRKIKELEERKKQKPLAKLEKALSNLQPTRDFNEAIKSAGRVKLIAEVKKASPSAGVIREPFNHVEIARLYEQGGASAISVLTDEEFFQGKLEYLTEIKQIVKLPLLRKDFIIDPYQIYEARAAGTDAILLIARILSNEKLKAYLKLSCELGMKCLVEVHDADELKKVLDADAAIIGINNRDLRTFKTDLETTFKLRPLIPEGKTVVSESGISTRDDVVRLKECGINAVLIGETLMRASDIVAKIRELFS